MSLMRIKIIDPNPKRKKWMLCTRTPRMSAKNELGNKKTASAVFLIALFHFNPPKTHLRCVRAIIPALQSGNDLTISFHINPHVARGALNNFHCRVNGFRVQIRKFALGDFTDVIFCYRTNFVFIGNSRTLFYARRFS